MENPQPHPSRAAVPLHSRSPGPPTPSTSGRCPLSSSLPAIEDGPKKEPHLSRDTRSFSPCLLEKWRPPSRSPFPSPKNHCALLDPQLRSPCFGMRTKQPPSPRPILPPWPLGPLNPSHCLHPCSWHPVAEGVGTAAAEQLVEASLSLR